MSQGLCFEDLQVGQVWRSRGRTVTEADVVNFACLTGDFDPLHVDHLAAAELPFHRPIAHGLLGLTWVAGLGSTQPEVQSLAFVAIRDWEFLRPLFFGDTVTAVNEIVKLMPKGKRRGHVVWLRKLINQRGEVVQQGNFETIVACRAERPVETVAAAASPAPASVSPAVEAAAVAAVPVVDAPQTDTTSTAPKSKKPAKPPKPRRPRSKSSASKRTARPKSPR